jgi:hypothetical protein
VKRRLVLAATAALCAAFASGCATTGGTFHELSASVPAVKPGEGRIYFFRSSSMFGAAIQPDIRLNGQVVGTSKPGGFFFVDRPAGSYVASTATETEKNVTFTLDPGETSTSAVRRVWASWWAG